MEAKNRLAGERPIVLNITTYGPGATLSDCDLWCHLPTHFLELFPMASHCAVVGCWGGGTASGG
jgi:hypothetical protein